MKKGELVQVDFESAMVGDAPVSCRVVGYVAILTSSYVTLSQGQSPDWVDSPNILSIPIGSITCSRLLEPGRKRSALPRQQPRKAARKSTAPAPAAKK